MDDAGSGEREDDRERVGVQGVDGNSVGEAIAEAGADPGDSAGEARRPVSRRTPLEPTAQEVAEHNPTQLPEKGSVVGFKHA